MGRIKLETPDQVMAGVLTETTLVGRHWRCDVVLNHPGVPLYWLELRWLASRWAWRCLGAEERTFGKGTPKQGGWRYLDVGHEVLLGPQVAKLSLMDGDAPGLVLEDLHSGQRLHGDERFDFVGLGAQGPHAVGDPEERPLVDGEIFESRGRHFRLWRPQGWQPTREPVIMITERGLLLEVDRESLCVRLWSEDAEVELCGEVVRALVPYVQARLDDPRNDDGGWRTNDEILAAWIALGGNVDSPRERMNWERNKLRSLLTELGVSRSDLLFERKRTAGTWRHRVALKAEVLRMI